MLGISAQFLQYGAALLLLPLIVIKLSPEEVGVWYVFMAVQGLAMLMDFGFQPTFARNFALAFSGAKELQKVGLSGSKQDTPNYALVADVLKAARAVYIGVALCVTFLLLTLGSRYIQSLIEDSSLAGKSNVYTAWFIFAFAVASTLYFSWVSPFLIGADRVDKNYIYLVVNRLIFAGLGTILLFSGFGLTGLSLSLLIAVITSRMIIQVFINPIIKKIKSESAIYEGVCTKSVISVVWHNASRLGLVSLGAFLIARYNIFVISHFVGLVAAASYGISLQIFMAVNASAQLLFQINLPKMVKARVNGNFRTLKRIFIHSTVFFLCWFLIGSILVMLLVGFLLDFIGSGTKLLDMNLLILLGTILLLEGNHTNSALTITTGNQVPFVYPALISGGAVVLLSTTSGYLGWGLLGIIASRGFVQLAYNNWKWPVVVLKEIWEMEK